MDSQGVVLDTDVFSAIYVTPREVVVRQGHPWDAWILLLSGKRTVISFQTRAEILSGAFSAGWGDRRLGAIRERLDATPTIDVDRDVVEAFARLSAESRKVGHALASKVHTADRWIAASAIAKGLPLLARDGIYAGAPGLELVTA